MASKTSSPDVEQPVIRMGEFARKIAARKAELGNPEIPRNAGAHRTGSKRALLKAIKDIGGDW